MDGTKHAVIQLFDSLNYYSKLIEESMPPDFYGSMDIDASHDDIAEAFNKYWKENSEFRDKQDYANKMGDEYLATVFAHATICGSILQVAHMAISKFSTYDGECLVLTEKYKRFGIGREVNNIPLGLVIYAGRNQYNHWDENAKLKTKEIFDFIATKNGALNYKDPCFDLEHEKLKIYSHNILGLIGWKIYEDYEKDILDMLSKFEEEA